MKRRVPCRNPILQFIAFSCQGIVLTQWRGNVLIDHAQWSTVYRHVRPGLLAIRIVVIIVVVFVQSIVVIVDGPGGQQVNRELGVVRQGLVLGVRLGDRKVLEDVGVLGSRRVEVGGFGVLGFLGRQVLRVNILLDMVILLI